tara:strand:- start:231 stop:497 length:267 start_codon:yes stop_codon:yes gene_type:complete
MRLVKVLWFDTNETSDSGWVSMADAKKDKPCKVASVGWLVHETEKFITIAADIDGNSIEEDKDDLLGRTQCFPKGCVESITTLLEEPN